MSEYTFTDGLGYSMAQLAEMDNLSFAGYFIPIQSTATDMGRYCLNNNVDLISTVVMHDGDNFVGMAMMARRGDRGYVAGFGIVPEYRGKGVGKLLMAQTIKVCREAGMTHLQLEVLEQNPRAIRLYQSCGFSINRTLVGLQLAAANIPKHSTNAKISPTLPEYIADWLLQGQQPAWSRERPSLAIVGGGAIVTNRPGGATAAMQYKLLEEGKRVQLYAVALIDRTSTNDLAFMLRHAAAQAETIKLQNEPDNSVLFQVCKDLGFTEEYRQHEMHLDILDSGAN